MKFPSPAYFPYYINTDRLVDISASLSNGYAEYEEVEVERTFSKSKGKSLKGKHSNTLFSIEGEINFQDSGEGKERSKSKRIHTTVSLLNNVIERVSTPNTSKDKTTIKGIEDYKCGDIIFFEGDVALAGREEDEGKRRFSEKTEGIHVAQNKETTERKQEIIASTKNAAQEMKKLTYSLIIFGAVFIFTVAAAVIFLSNRFLYPLDDNTLTILPILIALLVSVSITGIFHVIKTTKKDFQALNAINKARKKDVSKSKITICSKNADFSCYLRDDCFYSCSLSDIITKRVNCFGIFRETNAKNQRVAEVEIIALY